MSIKGISVIICCFNSERRLFPTLQALSRQDFTGKGEWEIILIDNACTDETISVAKAIWEAFNSPVKLVIEQEARPGLGYARTKGISCSNYSYYLFCDDDNALGPDYLTGCFRFMEANTSVAACGGMGVPVFQSQPPAWFHKVQEAYALGSQNTTSTSGKLLNLYGAGLMIRASSYDHLVRSGFKPLLKDRTGKQLSSSGDTELTNSLVLCNFYLAYLPELIFEHHLPDSRITREYLQKLYKAFGKDGPIRNIYFALISGSQHHKILLWWPGHLFLSVFRLIKYLFMPPKKNERLLYFKWSVSYLTSLFSLISTHKRIVSQLRELQFNSQELWRHNHAAKITSEKILHIQ